MSEILEEIVGENHDLEIRFQIPSKLAFLKKIELLVTTDEQIYIKYVTLLARGHPLVKDTLGHRCPSGSNCYIPINMWFQHEKDGLLMSEDLDLQLKLIITYDKSPKESKLLLSYQPITEEYRDKYKLDAEKKMKEVHDDIMSKRKKKVY